MRSARHVARARAVLVSLDRSPRKIDLGAVEPSDEGIQRRSIALEALGAPTSWSKIEPSAIDERFSEAFDDEEE